MLKKTLVAGLVLATTSFGAQANELEERIIELAKSQLGPWLADELVINEIRSQNADHDGFSQSQIDELDQTWRAQADAKDQPMIDGILARPASKYLKDRQKESSGLITEVIVMDNLGLNVAQSDPTSDYWQGDEDKFQQTFPKGAGEIHVSEIEVDESTGSYQVQVSMTISDPESGEAIGAATFGITLE